ncbi:hypothetical protein GY15_18635 [Delftia sp. 670]|nr:hypothetical protein GY15_18635 [Delftia sp. 670]
MRPSRRAVAVTRTSSSAVCGRAGAGRSSQPPWGWAEACRPLPASRRCSASAGSRRPWTAGAVLPASRELSAAMLVPVARARALMASDSGWAGRSMSAGAARAGVQASAAAQASRDRQARAGREERRAGGHGRERSPGYRLCSPV